MRHPSLLLIRKLLLVCILGACCFAQSSRKTVFLVRHAERASQADDSPLSQVGLQRAECLSHVLGDAGITTIFVTQFLRTKQTAEPLAKKLDLTPMTVQKDDINGLAQKVQSSSSGNVLIVAHSDTLPGIVQKLGEATIASIGNTEYDRLLIVNIGGSNAATVTTLHYCHCESATPGSAIQGMHPQR